MLDLAGLQDRFGVGEIDALADWDGDGVADAPVVARAIADAQERVEAACAARYRLPLSPVPGMVASVAADIAYYRLHLIAVPEEVWRRYQGALKTLDDIATGKLVLSAAPADSGGGSPAPADTGVLFSGGGGGIQCW